MSTMFNNKNKKDKAEEKPEPEVKEEKAATAEEAPKEEKKEDDALKREKDNVELLKKQLAQCQTEKEQWMNKYYTNLADIKNLRAEIERDAKFARDYAAEPFIKSLIPFLSSMDQAFRFEPKDDPKAEGWIKGIHLSYKQLLKSLEEENVKIIEPKVGDEFDARYMEAVDSVEGEKANLIAQVWMNGAMYREHLIKPATVVVTVKKPEPKPEEEKKVAPAGEDVKVESTEDKKEDNK